MQQRLRAIGGVPTPFAVAPRTTAAAYPTSADYR